MDEHKALIIRQKRQAEITLLAQSLHWVSRHSDIGALEMHQCQRIAEHVANSGAIRRIVALDGDEPVIETDATEEVITVDMAIRALNTEVARQWKGRRVPANPTVLANGVRNALRRLGDRGSQGK